VASFTLKNEAIFPVGTSVSAYPRSNWAFWQRPPSGAPKGSPAETQVVGAGGSVTFSALADATDYYAYAASPDRYVSFRTPAAVASGGGGGGSTSTQAERQRAGWVVTGAIQETGPRAAAGTAVNMPSGTLRLMGGCVLQAGVAITSMTLESVAAAVTPTHVWGCLVRLSDLAVLVKTNDDTGAWAAASPKTLTFSAPYTPGADTVAYVGIVQVAATPATVAGWGPQIGLSSLAPIMAGNSTTGLTDPASLGATAAALTGSGGAPWIALS